MKYFVIGLALAAVVTALAMAGIYMVRGSRDGGSKGGDMMRALAVRIGLSVLLFIGIVVAWRLGWISPTGVPLAR